MLTHSISLQQKRQKTFIKQMDRNGQTYYTVNRRKDSQAKLPQPHELFAITDHLLDLDAWESKHVRPVSEEDEKLLDKKWSVSHKRNELQSRMLQLEDELNWSRRKVFEISSQPANPQRLESHDIFSVALRGSSLLSSQTGLSQARHQSTSASTPTDLLDPEKYFSHINTISSENGIPERAQASDENLLHWLRFRQQQHQTQRRPEVSTPLIQRFTADMRAQDSIAGIRRLVFRYLSSGLDATSLYSASPHSSRRPIAMSSALREACETILGKYRAKHEGYLEVLTLLGNLNHRLATEGGHLGSSLCGYALRLSAEDCQVATTAEYLDLGFSHQYWDGDQAMRDLLLCLRAYTHHMRILSSQDILNTHDRQTLLQLLTGTGVETNFDEKSFRSIVLDNLESPKTERTPRLAVEVYQAYIYLLGQLGAVATLWSEWQQSAARVDELLEDGNLPAGKGGSVASLAETFQSAVGASLSVVALRDASSADLDLAGCAMLDYQSMSDQNSEAWVGHRQERREFAKEDLRAALDLPLDKWLEQVRHLAS